MSGLEFHITMVYHPRSKYGGDSKFSLILENQRSGLKKLFSGFMVLLARGMNDLSSFLILTGSFFNTVGLGIDNGHCFHLI